VQPSFYKVVLRFQNLTGKDSDGDNLEFDLLTGFHAGINVQIPVAEEIFFRPGLLFSTKGAQEKDASVTTKIKLSYLEMPLNLVYKGLLGKGHVMLGLGPYLGYAIGGKVMAGDVKEDIEFTNEIDPDGSGSTFFKRFDAGANIFAGYELANGILLQLNTQLGLLKINPKITGESENEASIKNTGFGLSAGYRF
jgi:hypothetical protein